MRRLLTLTFPFFLLLLPLHGQTFTDSNLPIVVITTDGGASIPDEPGVKGNMKIIYRGPGLRNYLTDQNTPAFLNYSGRIDIEIRGSSSQESPKKNYGFTTLMADNLTNNNVTLMGMPPENDWILGGMVFDTAMIRDFLTLSLSRRIGNYAPRCEYCEVLINGDYRGLYLLQEKIKADNNRVDVHKITAADNLLPAISGGYITKADKSTGGDQIAWTMYSWFGSPVEYIHHFPKPEDATTQQTNYIRGEFFKLETAAKNNDISLITGYPSLIDVPSFVDFMLLNEFAGNPDAYTYSTYFHKDLNGKLRAGPMWDIDLSYGNDLFQWYLDRSKPDIWFFQDYQNDGSRFWRDLFYNTQFRCYLSRRFHELIQPGEPLNKSDLDSFIDQTVALISEAVARDYTRWGKTGTHAQRITGIKNFITARLNWMSANIGSFSACSNVAVPPLVITRIMYHPMVTPEFPDGDDLEFIEIRNNGTQTVILTGIYFRGTGLVYQFPANSTLAPGSCVILASNSAEFQRKYGFAPYGQFTRQLSNNSQTITLADGFGNIIDNLTYSDAFPWPVADGNGSYLKLTDINLDNALPSSWIASNDIITAADDLPFTGNLRLFPNPVSDWLHITADRPLIAVIITDLSGRTMFNFEPETGSYDLDMTGFKPGTYILTVVTEGKTWTEKIVRK
jgi:hypothetical protein